MRKISKGHVREEERLRLFKEHRCGRTFLGHPAWPFVFDKFERHRFIMLLWKKSVFGASFRLFNPILVRGKYFPT